MKEKVICSSCGKEVGISTCLRFPKNLSAFLKRAIFRPQHHLALPLSSTGRGQTRRSGARIQIPLSAAQKNKHFVLAFLWRRRRDLKNFTQFIPYNAMCLNSLNSPSSPLFIVGFNTD